MYKKGSSLKDILDVFQLTAKDKLTYEDAKHGIDIVTGAGIGALRGLLGILPNPAVTNDNGMLPSTMRGALNHNAAAYSIYSGLK